MHLNNKNYKLLIASNLSYNHFKIQKFLIIKLLRTNALCEQLLLSFMKTI